MIALENYGEHLFECLGKKIDCPNQCGASIKSLEEANNHII